MDIEQQRIDVRQILGEARKRQLRGIITVQNAIDKRIINEGGMLCVIKLEPDPIESSTGQ